MHCSCFMLCYLGYKHCIFCVCNPHSANPSKYKGNLNQKPLDFIAAPMLSVLCSRVRFNLMKETEIVINYISIKCPKNTVKWPLQFPGVYVKVFKWLPFSYELYKSLRYSVYNDIKQKNDKNSSGSRSWTQEMFSIFA